METNIIQSLISLVAVVATAFVTWSIAQRRLMGEHVTAERTKWRQKIRECASEAHDAIMSGKICDASKLQNEFRVLLNPFDPDDREILCRIDAQGSDACRENRARELGRLISLLLKHDWERAKLEAGFFAFRWFVEPKRVSLERACRKNGKCERHALAWSEKFGIKWKRFFACAGLVLSVIMIWYWLCRSISQTD